MKKILMVLFLGLLISCKSQSDNPTSVEEQKFEFTKNIERNAKNDFENNLILKAEAVYPPRDSVLAIMPPELAKANPVAEYWYYSQFDGILIPYAVNSGAINYYSRMIDSLNANNGYNFLLSAKFDYSADIKFKESYTFEGKNLFSGRQMPSVSFSRVYVVSMTLKWENYCGPVCGLWISHQRVVVLDESGNILRVFYDGPIPVAVS